MYNYNLSNMFKFIFNYSFLVKTSGHKGTTFQMLKFYSFSFLK